MVQPHDEQPLPELEGLKAPYRTEAVRRAARQRIVAAAEPLLARRQGTATSWEVLAAWARPGLVAATIALLVLAGGLELASQRRPSGEPVALEEVLVSTANGEGSALLLAAAEPDADALLGAALRARDGSGTPIPETEQW
jgi:hypothetical protein